mgnify:CR=1 FL=1
MASTYTVLLSELASEFKLDFFYRSTDFDKIHVTVDDISRPGLHLAGFFDHYEPMRVYVCGTVETAYLQKLTPEERIIIFDHFLSYKCPALIFARGFEPMPECLEMAKKYDVTVLGTKDTTSYIVSSLITYLKSSLAPRVTRHGVLVEIYGEGILINGDSGIGKSETAIELVKRGHRLIADDAVEIKKVSPHELVGSAPPVLKHYIELRGIGVINVAKLFGMELSRWDTESGSYDVENDFHGIFFLCGGVGLVLLLGYLGWFVVLVIRGFVKKKFALLTPEFVALLVSLVTCAAHIYATSGVLRRPNASFYLAVCLALCWKDCKDALAPAISE